MSRIDDALFIQHQCLLGRHRWALCGVRMPEGHFKLTGGEICLDCHERKPLPEIIVTLPENYFEVPVVLRSEATVRS